MHLAKTYLNERIELLDGDYASERQAELGSVQRLYNRFLGPVTAVHLHRPELSDFSMYTSSCTHVAMSRLMRDLTVRSRAVEGMQIPSGGKGAGMLLPALSALGEASERLLAVFHFAAVVDDLEWATHEELERRGWRALGPHELALFAPEQYAEKAFAFAPFRRDARLRWIEGRDLLTGEATWLPAQLVLLYYERRAAEQLIGYPTSGGLGFHSDRRRAILHGLYEYVERDAINVRWYCRLPPPRVIIDVRSRLASRWPQYLWRVATPSIESIGVQLATLDLPVPVLTVTTLDGFRRERAFIGGGGAGGSRERALTQALFEVGQTRSVLNSYQPKRERVIGPDSVAAEMTDFLDGTVYFGYAQNLQRLDWYTSGGPAVAWEEVPSPVCANATDEYDGARRWLGAAGLHPIVFELNAAGWPGVHVVRVIVPQLTPAGVAAHPYLGHPRYYDLPKRLGVVDRNLAFDDLNTDPIPFP